MSDLRPHPLGGLSGEVTLDAAERGQQGRALTRDRSRVNLPVEVEIVESDMTDPADLRRALDGIDRAFLKKVVHDNGNHFAAVASEVG